jgi:hypothetical protein
MTIVNGSMTVKCNKCGKIHTIPAEESDFENSYGEVRQMGPENGYTWEHKINCDCGNEIEIIYEVWEYPEGVFNNDNITVNGGILIDKFGYDFHEEPEPDDN